MPRIIVAPASVLGILALSLRSGLRCLATFAVESPTRARAAQSPAHVSSSSAVPSTRSPTSRARSCYVARSRARSNCAFVRSVMRRATSRSRSPTDERRSSTSHSRQSRRASTRSSFTRTATRRTHSPSAGARSSNPHIATSASCYKRHRALSSLARRPGLTQPYLDSRIGANEVLVVVDGNPINSPITGEADLSDVQLETVGSVCACYRARSRHATADARSPALFSSRRDARALEDRARHRSARGVSEARASRSGKRATHTNDRVTGSLRRIIAIQRGDFSYDIPSVRGGGVARRINGDAQSVDVLATAAIEGTADQPSELRVPVRVADASSRLAGIDRAAVDHGTDNVTRVSPAESTDGGRSVESRGARTLTARASTLSSAIPRRPSVRLTTTRSMRIVSRLGPSPPPVHVMDR